MRDSHNFGSYINRHGIYIAIFTHLISFGKLIRKYITALQHQYFQALKQALKIRVVLIVSKLFHLTNIIHEEEYPSLH